MKRHKRSRTVWRAPRKGERCTDRETGRAGTITATRMGQASVFVLFDGATAPAYRGIDTIYYGAWRPAEERSER